MADYCEGGQFDGYTLTTPRDRQLCGEGGGRVVSRGDTGGGCAGDTVQSYAAAGGRQADVNPLYVARSFWRDTRVDEVLTALSERAVPAVEHLIREDQGLADEFISALARLAELADAAVTTDSDEPVYREEDHERFSKLARVVAERGGDDRLSELVETAVSLGEEFQNLTPREIQERLGPVPDALDAEETETEFEIPVPGPDTDSVEAPWSSPWLRRPILTDAVQWDLFPIRAILEELRDAEAAIAEKARSLGNLAANPQGDMKPVDGGFMRSFADCDIYYSAATGAHELHGDIRRKYRQVSGPTRLGLPTTDETSCPDGAGRYNHFAKSASIYWAPTTGPFYVRGGVRFRWASSGWEAGPMGYPVRDEEGMGGLYPSDNPDMQWSHFQHGMIFRHGTEAQFALAATASMTQIKDAIQSAISKRLPARTYDVGWISVTVRPGLYGVDFVRTDDWGYGFNGSTPRQLRLKVRGFVSLPIVSDPTFEIDLGLRFATTWQTTGFTFPTSKTVIAILSYLKISVRGVASDMIYDAIHEGVKGAFSPGQGRPDLPEGSMFLATVPTGANQRGSGNLDFLDVMLQADGSLSVFVNPLPAIPGAIRRLVAQSALDSALETL